MRSIEPGKIFIFVWKPAIFRCDGIDGMNSIKKGMQDNGGMGIARSALRRMAGMVLAGFMIPGAVFLSMGCAGGGLPDDAAVSVNGSIILKADVDARIVYRNKLFPGMVSSDDELNFPKIRRQTTKDLVWSELEQQEARRRGISVTAADVDAEMVEMADDDYLGDVSRMMEIYNDMGVTEEELKAATFERLIHERLTAEVSRAAAVSDYDVQMYYDKNLMMYQQSEKRQSRMIEAPSEETARDAYLRITSGESFVEVARQLSIDPLAATNGGTLGLVSRGQLSPELDTVLFGLAAGAVSEPVMVADKWYVLKVESIHPGEGRSLEETREEIRQTIAIEISASDWQSLMEALYNDASLEYDPEYDPELS